MTIEQLYEIFLSHPVITTDSRDCPEGSIFFALKGETFDGNQYAMAALEKGCAYAVVDDATAVNGCCNNAGHRLLLTDDVLTTLQKLANYHRRQLGTRIIGVTGTNGKTTTKELISTVLAEKYNVLYTQGNFNNHIGVPKTLLRLTKQHDIAVIEMGANHPGEIKTLVNIVEPDYGIITNVGKAHILGFGSFEGVIKTKGELYDFLREKPNAKVFINNDNSYLKGISAGLDLIKYGTQHDDSLSVWGEVTKCDPFLNFKFQVSSLKSPSYGEGLGVGFYVNTHLIGSYNIDNMLAAACIGQYFGITTEQISHALSNYIPSNNRSQLDVTADNRLIIDAYNANPTSMMAALKNFRDMQVEPKMAILGDMRELGTISLEEHQRVVDFLQENNLHDIWLVGEEFGKTDCNYRKFHDVDEVKQAIASCKPTGKYILIKGSNGIKLFQLPELL
ncbi:MAG: UDP-N-acetylmuramoyl-tripeptide--D-alanyl-D-alanine ligase [Prevotellaceae bacterium]|nr:UDP-N-acetylmuramoyl-tripeptide--D-alanyl-D-alanine ligase [Prevotellaceae bacterium]